MTGCLDIVGNLKALKAIAIAYAAPGHMHDRVGPEFAHHRRDLNPISKIGGDELEMRDDIPKKPTPPPRAHRSRNLIPHTHPSAHDPATHKNAHAADTK